MWIMRDSDKKKITCELAEEYVLTKMTEWGANPTIVHCTEPHSVDGVLTVTVHACDCNGENYEWAVWWDNESNQPYGEC